MPTVVPMTERKVGAVWQSSSSTRYSSSGSAPGRQIFSWDGHAGQAQLAHLLPARWIRGSRRSRPLLFGWHQACLRTNGAHAVEQGFQGFVLSRIMGGLQSGFRRCRESGGLARQRAAIAMHHGQLVLAFLARTGCRAAGARPDERKDAVLRQVYARQATAVGVHRPGCRPGRWCRPKRHAASPLAQKPRSPGTAGCEKACTAQHAIHAAGHGNACAPDWLAADGQIGHGRSGGSSRSWRCPVHRPGLLRSGRLLRSAREHEGAAAVGHQAAPHAPSRVGDGGPEHVPMVSGSRMKVFVLLRPGACGHGHPASCSRVVPNSCMQCRGQRIGCRHRQHRLKRVSNGCGSRTCRAVIPLRPKVAERWAP